MKSKHNLILVLFAGLFLWSTGIPCHSKSPRNNKVAFEKAVDDSMHYLHLRDSKNALRLAGQAIKFQPKRLEGYELRAYIDLSPRKAKQAILDLERALKINPDLYYLHVFISYAYFHARDVKRAEEHAKRAIALDPSESKAHNFLRLVYKKSRRSSKAADALVNSIQNELTTALKLERQGKANQALDFYNKYIAKHPKAAGAYHLRGMAFQYQKQYQRAIKDFQKAYSLNRMRSKDVDLIGRCYQSMGEMNKALHYLEKAHYLHSSDEISAFRYAQLLSKLGKNKKAINVYTLCIKFKGNNASAFRLRADSYFKLKKYNLALSDYSAAIEYSLQADPDTYRKRSKVYKILGRDSLARKDIESAKRLDRY